MKLSPRAPPDVHVLTVLDFQIPCFRPETPAFYPRSLPTIHEGHGRLFDLAELKLEMWILA